MLRLRFWIAGSLLWLFVLCNLHWLDPPAAFTPLLYLLATIAGVIAISLQPIRTSSLAALVALSVCLLVFLKWWFGYPMTGNGLPLTVTESGALALTVFLSHRLSDCLTEFEAGVAEVMMLQFRNRSIPSESGQDRILRELRRARRFRRSLTLALVRTDSVPPCEEQNRLMADVWRNLAPLYAKARLADLLVSEISDCDVLADWHDQFVLLLPETDAAHASPLVQRLAETVFAKTGMTLQVGTATFPDDEISLTGLLETANRMIAPVETSQAATQPTSHRFPGINKQTWSVG
jgi:hypothetical protein